jgi:hypothetical protein
LAARRGSRDWLREKAVIKASASVYHQGNNTCHLFLICALTKSQRNGNRLRQD